MIGGDDLVWRIWCASRSQKRLIKKALQKFRYKKTRAASFLGINRNTLDKKIKELQIEY